MVPVDMRAIPGYDGYFAGSDGNIYSAWIRRASKKRESGVIKLKPHDSKGYLYVNPRKSPHKRVHRLVFIAFNHPIPEGMTINHIDGNKHNNRPENLECVSLSENIKHAVATGLKVSAKGELAHRSKLKQTQVDEIKKRYASGETQKAIGKLFGLRQSYISLILSGKRWVNG